MDMPELTHSTQQFEVGTTRLSEAWPVRVISLTDSNERRKRMREQLERLSIPFEFVDAIDGRTGLAPELESMIDRPGTEAEFRRCMTDAEYACALSHMMIYRQILNNDLPGAVVLEDDAILGSLFQEFLDTKGYEAGDLIQLDHWKGGVWKHFRRYRLTANIELARASKNADLTTGYTISRTAAAHILMHGLPLRAPADWPCDVSVLRTMLALPRVVDHPEIGGGESFIETERAGFKRRPPPNKNRSLRFFKRSYWRRWWVKRMTKQVS